MGVCVVTLDAACTQQMDQVRRVVGYITLSNSYANGTGDTTTVGAFGLGILQDLYINQTRINAEVSDTVPIIGTSTTVHIKAFGTGLADADIFDEISNATDLSGIKMRFEAWGW